MAAVKSSSIAVEPNIQASTVSDLCFWPMTVSSYIDQYGERADSAYNSEV